MKEVGMEEQREDACPKKDRTLVLSVCWVGSDTPTEAFPQGPWRA